MGYRDIHEMDHTANVLRVTWTKATNYWSNFARTFLEARAEFHAHNWGPDWPSFGYWLTMKTGLSEQHVARTILSYQNEIAAEDRARLQAIADDAVRIKREQAAQKKAEAIARALARREEITARDAERAKTRAEKAQAKAVREAAKRRERANARARERYTARVAAQAQARAQKAVQAALSGSDVLARSAAMVAQGLTLTPQGRTTWIDGVLLIAQGLAEARAHCPSNREFGVWLTAHSFNFNDSERAEYIRMGEHPAVARRVLANSDSWSVNLIGQRELQPELLRLSQLAADPDHVDPVH